MQARQLIESLVESDDDHRQALDATGFWGKQGAGCIFLARDTHRIMLAHRSEDVQEPGTWGTWGGAIDASERPLNAVEREVYEETGYRGSLELAALKVFKKGSFEYHNFLAIVDQEFTPRLNWENQGFAWCAFGKWPEPLHFGLKNLLRDPQSVAIIQAKLKPRVSESSARAPTCRAIIEAEEARVRPKIVVKQRPRHDTVFSAYIKGRVAGHLIVDQYSSPRSVYKSEVKPEYRRMGVATALYRAAEAVWGEMVPSKTALSDDAFGFWNAYRPGVFPQHNLRHHRNELIGKQIVDPRYGPGIIKSVGDSGVIAEMPDGRTFFTRDNLQRLLPGI